VGSDVAAAAARSNAALCAAVCAGNGIASTSDGLVWRCDGVPPPLFPALVTLAAGTADADVSGVLGGIKDSFSVLEPRRFRLAVEGRWLWRDAPPGRGAPWSVAATAAEVQAWTDRRTGGATGAFGAWVLRDPRVALVSLDGGACVLFDGGDVIDVSNLSGSATYDAAAAAAGELFGDRPLAAWESGAVPPGWADAGAMRVWLPE